MKEQNETRQQGLSGDELLRALSALANPHRLRVVAALEGGGRNYVSQLARELGISRPLLHMHLKRLEAVGLVSSELEVSDDGKAMNYYEVRAFDLRLTPELVAEAVRTPTVQRAGGGAGGGAAGEIANEPKEEKDER